MIRIRVVNLQEFARAGYHCSNFARPLRDEDLDPVLKGLVSVFGFSMVLVTVVGSEDGFGRFILYRRVQSDGCNCDERQVMGIEWTSNVSACANNI